MPVLQAAGNRLNTSETALPAALAQTLALALAYAQAKTQPEPLPCLFIPIGYRSVPVLKMATSPQRKRTGILPLCVNLFRCALA
ncbi:hypothetical protein EBB79_14635 [Parasedimentitalea marina]|uniref:Uncharacterized protein n=1 Tax=Parasedimentitalea marina TaxID=2483033 RepID=A0A3T0N4L5_9RHOB|nr:hypothetical protein [Parasedimentitalea marina]AZV78983.1 hypothetical protein EBB79_14635 [Parasedimentitalea marina]